MNNLIKTIFGTSPRTTILGGLMAIVAAIAPFVAPEYQKACAITLAVLGALYGRVSKDSNGVTRQEGKALAEKIDPVVPKESIL